MSTIHRRAITLALATLAMLVPLGVPAAPRTAAAAPKVIDLGTLGGSSSTARDVNDAGVVVGVSQREGDTFARAFQWTERAHMHGLGTLGGINSDAASINDRGQVVGWSDVPGGARHAFLWQADTGMRDLGTLGGPSSEAVSINDSGVVIGMSDMPGGAFPRHAFIWDATRGIRDLGLGGAVVRAINDAGQIVGTAGNAFVWDAVHGLRDLGALGGSATNGMAINHRGDVAGGVQDISMGPEIGVLWPAGGGANLMGKLPALPPWTAGCCSNALGLNDSAVAVGWALVDGDDVSRAFVWDAVGGMRDLGTLGGEDATAYAINNSGTIVGESVRSDGHQHAAMWVLPADATPPTVTCVAPAPVFLLHQAGAVVTAKVTDAGAGPVRAIVSAAADVSKVGARTVKLTGADRAGNTTTVACPYAVTYRTSAGFFSGVVNGNGIVNIARAGRIVGVRWRITDAAGVPVAGLTSVTLTSAPTMVDPAATTDPIEAYANGPLGLRSRGDGTYQYDWQTSAGWAGTTRILRIDLGEGSPRTALFRFTS
jgi:probable HAF family extracellular repeat protein